MYSLEPTDGPAYSTYLPILEKYFVSGSSSSATSTSSEVQTSTSTTAGTTKTATSTATTPTESSGGGAKHYDQCGGMNWTGATSCESPYTCVEQGPYYSQCL